MKFFTAWVQVDESYHPTQHQRNDEQVMSYRIIHQEGKAPLLKLTVAKNNKTRATNQLIFSTNHPTYPVLFYGKLLQQLPCQNKQHETLIFLAISAFHEKSWEACQKKLKQINTYDVLLDKGTAHADVLEGGLLLPHFSRQQEAITLSHIVSASKINHLGTHYFSKSFQTKTNPVPYQEIRVQLQAEWLQTAQGSFDVMPLIEQHARNQLNSFTPLHYLWWKKGVKQKNYTVVESQLKPQKIEKISFSNNTAPAATLDRYWYEGTLKIGFSYQQKRKEVVTFTLSNASLFSSYPPKTSLKQKNTKHINFKLKDILGDYETPLWQPNTSYEARDMIQYGELTYQCLKAHHSHKQFVDDISHWESIPTNKSPLQSPESASYFTTTRGTKSIICAAEHAYAHLVRANRHMETSFVTSLEKAIDIDCDQSLTITTPHHKTRTGKVIAYQLIGSQKGHFAKITLATLASGEMKIKEESTDPPDFTTPSGIAFTGLKDVCIPGLTSSHFQNPNTFIRAVALQNSGDEQMKMIAQEAATQPPTLTLQKTPTRLSLSLRDLTPLPCLTHTISLSTTNA